MVARAGPAVLLTQETKLADAAAPVAEFGATGYELAHHGEGRWNGVAIGAVKVLEDPEAMFQEGYLICYAGDKERGLRRAVTKGYFVVETLTRCAAFDRVREDPVFREILAEAVAGRDRALLAFRERGGEKLLGAVAA